MHKGKCYSKEYLLSKIYEFVIANSIEMDVQWINNNIYR